jgi:hypothetical protein
MSLIGLRVNRKRGYLFPSESACVDCSMLWAQRDYCVFFQKTILRNLKARVCVRVGEVLRDDRWKIESLAKERGGYSVD